MNGKFFSKIFYKTGGFGRLFSAQKSMKILTPHPSPLPSGERDGVRGIFVPKDEKGGVALILVIWIIVMLMAIVGEFSYSMRTELNILRNFNEEEIAYQLALAGIERAKFEILSVKESSYVYMNEEGILAFEDGDENPVRKGELGNSTFSYVITDENAKLNINKAPLSQLKPFIRNTGVDITEVDTIVDSIIDWRDTNDLHMLNGAEEDYYRSLENPYSCKDGPFDAVDDLLLVKGVTEEIFYGTAERERDDDDDDDQQVYDGIAQYITTWGSGKININTASANVLEAVLGSQKAEEIISQREIAPITSPQSGGMVRSFFFTVISTGTAGDDKIKREIKTTLRQRGKQLEVVYWNDNFTG